MFPKKAGGPPPVEDQALEMAMAQEAQPMPMGAEEMPMEEAPMEEMPMEDPAAAGADPTEMLIAQFNEMIASGMAPDEAFRMIIEMQQEVPEEAPMPEEEPMV